MSLSSHPSLLSLLRWWLPLLASYMVVEVAFYLVYVFYIIPRANQRTPPHPYRDYGRDRHKLLVRIIDRIERTSRVKHRDLFQTIETFLADWFYEVRPTKKSDDDDDVKKIDNQQHKVLLSNIPRLSRVSSLSSSPEGSVCDEPSAFNQDNDLSSPVKWSLMKNLRKGDMDDFFAWAFFGKSMESIHDWETEEMQKMYQILQNRLGLTFAPGRSQQFISRRLTLDNVDPLHRPLSVYLFVALLKLFGDVVLHLSGFRRQVSRSGLVYWYRPAQQGPRCSPLLFFHGIAPGSLSLYLPALFWGVASSNRDVFLFENKPISCSIGFGALSEDETVQGVEEALQMNPVDRDLCLCGHSFGTCQLTWLLHSSKIRPRIRQLVLLDPVTIVLSEPDVVVNFLYSRQRMPPPPNASWLERWQAWFSRTKIRLVASSEVFVEYYLRRNFSWYNSEMWLEDVPSNVDVLVCVAEADEITNAKKIQEEVEIHNMHSDTTKTAHVRVLQWKNQGHAFCLTSPAAWKDVKIHMRSHNESRARTKHD